MLLNIINASLAVAFVASIAAAAFTAATITQRRRQSRAAWDALTEATLELHHAASAGAAVGPLISSLRVIHQSLRTGKYKEAAYSIQSFHSWARDTYFETVFGRLEREFAGADGPEYEKARTLRDSALWFLKTHQSGCAVSAAKTALRELEQSRVK